MMGLREKLVPPNAPSPEPLRQQAAPVPSNNFNYIRSFNYMTERRLLRKLKGTYQKYSYVMHWLSTIVWVYVLFVLIVSSVVGAEKTELSVNDVAVIACVFYVALYFAQKMASRLLLLMIYCMVLAHATFYAVADDFGLFAIATTSKNNSSEAKHKTLRIVVLSILFAVELTIVAGYIAIYKLYPLALQRAWLNTETWFGIQRGRRSNTLTYMSRLRRWTTKRARIEYIGGLDADHRPHGFGLWKDSAYHGENLSGLWEHGIPIGPFTSREQGSGFTTEKLRIAYASIRGEATTDSADIMPTFQPLTWGVANVEVSVAGGFFSFLPSVEHFFVPGKTTDSDLLHYRPRPQSAAECLATLRTPLDYVAYHDVDGQLHEPRASRQETGQSVHRRTKCQHFQESLAPVAVAPNARPAVHPHTNKQALVYIHGIYTPLDSALSSIAQIMALGDFPSNVHPFVFAWPSGSLPLYFFQSLKAAGDTQSAIGLRDFLASIVDAGYAQVNIVTHSMGTRCLFNCIERGYLLDLFELTPNAMTTVISTNNTTNNNFSDINSCTTSLNPNRVKSKIVSFTFCSPEYPLPPFVAVGGMFDNIRQYCDFITLYGDSQDQALLGSEFALSDNLLEHGRVPSLGRSINRHVRDPSFEAVASSCGIDIRANRNHLSNHDSAQQAPPASTGELDATVDDAVKDLSYAQVNQRANLPNVAGFALLGTTVSSQQASSFQPVDEEPWLVDDAIDAIEPLLLPPSPLPTSVTTNKPSNTTTQSTITATPPATHSSYGSVPLSYVLNMHSTCVQSNGSDVDSPARTKIYLDMDVIDTSFVDVNTGMRHSYYRLNSNIVDDIREIVLHKRRARARPGLMKQQGNVFIFLAAPSNVGST